MTPSLQKLRDELARDASKEFGVSRNSKIAEGDYFQGHIAGFSAALATLSESAGEFDEDAMKDYAISSTNGIATKQAFVKGARRQFEADRARIGRAEAMKGEYLLRMQDYATSVTVFADKLKQAERERDAYKKPVYEYVQATGNTSPKTLGYHVAEALVMDHKDLKEKLASALAAIGHLRGAAQRVVDACSLERWNINTTNVDMLEHALSATSGYERSGE